MDELEQARLNRERVKQGYGNEFYANQACICAQWHLGDLPPRELILGALPEVNPKQIRLDRDWGLVVE